MIRISFGHKYPGGVPQGRGQRPQICPHTSGAILWM